jgi:hypothetical protein
VTIRVARRQPRRRWDSVTLGCCATVFLTRMKGKTVMFVGDLLGRNQWESLVCLLHAAAPQSPAQLVSADPLYTYKFLVCHVNTCTS